MPNSTLRFPQLKETVRICSFSNYLWVVEGISGFQHIALPVEVAVLTLCDGASSLQAIINNINIKCCHGADINKAERVVKTVMLRFSEALMPGDGKTRSELRYSFEDYLYPIRPLRQFPQRLPHPVGMLLTLTNRCNLHCIYCFNASGHARKDELCTKEWLDVIARAQDIGVQQIDLSGGEPFCHEGILDVMRDIRRRDILMEVATNGVMSYSNEAIGLMAGSRIDISLDTLNQKTYSELTEKPLLDRALNNIRRFVESGLIVDIKVCITNRNIHGIEQIYETLSNIGVHSVGLASYVPSPCGRGGDSLLLTQEMIDDIKERYDRIQQSPDTSLTIGLAQSYWHEPKDIMACDAMTHTMIVLSNGDITPCELITSNAQFMFGNVRHQSLLEIWNGEPVKNFFRQRVMPTDDRCASCSQLEHCGTGCFAEKLYKKVQVYGHDPRCCITSTAR